MSARRLAWLCSVLALLHAGAVQAATYRDDAGRDVVIDAPPRRVITLAPNLTEFVYAVGAGASLVATVDASVYPPQARALPHIGDHRRLDVERILSLAPDLVLAWHHGNNGREIEQLQGAGVRFFFLEPRRLPDVPRALERVGELFARGEQGRAKADALRRQLDALRSRYERAAPVSVFYQVWPQPLMTLNGDHLVSDMMTLCGARNVFASLASLVPRLSTEAVIAANPQVLLAPDLERQDGDAFRRDPTLAALAQWQRFDGMTAVKRGWFYALPAATFTGQSPRVAEGAAALCAALDEVRRERAAAHQGAR